MIHVYDFIIPYPGCASELPITTPAPEIPPSKNYSTLAKAMAIKAFIF